LAIIVMVIIFLASATPGSIIRASGFGNNFWQVNAHFFLFALLYTGYFKATKNLKISLVLTLIYAILDEFHQGFVPLRSVSLQDIVVDFAAGVAVALVLWKFGQNLPKKLRGWLNN